MPDHLRSLANVAVAVVAVATAAAAVAAITILEAFSARRRSPTHMHEIPVWTGLIGSEDDGNPLELAILGDSLGVGMGAADPEHTIGVLLAESIVGETGRSVLLRNAAVVGAESKDLAGQIARLVHPGVHLEVVVITVGGNDVMHLRAVRGSVRYLSDAVRQLRAMGCHVVVATCPDMGTVRLFRQPLRFVAHVMSVLLATAQTIVVLRAGGRTVSMAEVIGPAFRRTPELFFSADQVHPSSQGYARAASALLPSVCAAAGHWTGLDVRVPYRIYRHDRRIHRLAWFAFRAVRHPGTEVSAVPGKERSLMRVVRRTMQRKGGPRLPTQ